MAASARLDSMLSAVEAACGIGRKRVPKSWRETPPGQPVDCPKRDAGRVGSEVELRREGTVRVVGCASPVLPSSKARALRSPRYRCQGAWWVKTPLGIEFAVPKSIVRERKRTLTRGERCEREILLPSRLVKEWVDSGALTPEAVRDIGLPEGDLPFPHRRGSSPCCAQGDLGRAVEVLRAVEGPALDLAREEACRDPWEAGDYESMEDCERENFEAIVATADKLIRSDPRPEVREARTLVGHCRELVDRALERKLPKAEGSYAAELASLKRSIRQAAERGEAGADIEDRTAAALGDLREKFEVRSTRALPAEWFSWGSAARSQLERRYREQMHSWSAEEKERYRARELRAMGVK